MITGGERLRLVASLPFDRCIPARSLVGACYLDWIWVIKPNPMGKYRFVGPYGPFKLDVLHNNFFFFWLTPTFVLIELIHLDHFSLFVILFRCIIIITIGEVL